MDFTPVRKTSAYEFIVEQIENGISSGELRVGDRLPGERQLMASFSVSRATVREALRVLQATGVVDSRPGDPRGPVVMPFRPDVLERPLSRLAQQEEISRVELLQFRIMLEGQAALLAAVRSDEAALDAVDEAARHIGELLGDGHVDSTQPDGAQSDGSQSDPGRIDPEEFGRRVADLHAVIRRASGNQLIQTCGTAVGTALTEIVSRRLRDEADRERRLRRSASDAATLASLIRAGDATGAQRAATSNIYRYYRDGLRPEEQVLLEPMVVPSA